MVNSGHEKEANQESPQAEAGAIRRSAKAGVGSGEEEKIISAIVSVLTHRFREGAGWENRIIYETEALMIARDVISKLNHF